MFGNATAVLLGMPKVILLGATVLVLSIMMVSCGPSTEECLRDFPCVRDNTKWKLDAEPECARRIESYAFYDVRWTNGWLEPKMEWATNSFDNGAGVVVFSGNNVEFQNAFGVWRQYGYYCYYDPVSESVVSVDVYE